MPISDELKEELIEEEVHRVREWLEQLSSDIDYPYRSRIHNTGEGAVRAFVEDVFGAHEPMIEKWGGWRMESDVFQHDVSSSFSYEKLRNLHERALIHWRNRLVELAGIPGSLADGTGTVINTALMNAHPRVGWARMSDYTNEVSTSLSGGLVDERMCDRISPECIVSYNTAYRGPFFSGNDHRGLIRRALGALLFTEGLDMSGIEHLFKPYIREELPGRNGFNPAALNEASYRPLKGAPFNLRPGQKITRALMKVARLHYASAELFEIDKPYHEKFLSDLGQSISVGGRDMRGCLSVAPSDFIRLGHMMSYGGSSCYRIGSDFGDAKFVIAATPGTFVVTGRFEEKSSSEGDGGKWFEDYRAWGYMDKDQRHAIFTNFYSAQGESDCRNFVAAMTRSMFGDHVERQDVEAHACPVPNHPLVYKNRDGRLMMVLANPEDALVQPKRSIARSMKWRLPKLENFPCTKNTTTGCYCCDGRFLTQNMLSCSCGHAVCGRCGTSTRRDYRYVITCVRCRSTEGETVSEATTREATTAPTVEEMPF